MFGKDEELKIGNNLKLYFYILDINDVLKAIFFVTIPSSSIILKKTNAPNPIIHKESVP